MPHAPIRLHCDMTGEYGGGELELFADATNWKAYVAGHITPHVTGRVLEVGAGIGSNIANLTNGKVTDWLALEPDPQLTAEIERKSRDGDLPPFCRIMTGTLDDIPSHERFDTILYVDVLEHIDDDRSEVDKAARLLALGGRLVVLAPAHQFLFSAFDRSIGHFRRYNMPSLRALTPVGCRVVRLFMLDSAGFFLSLANRVILRSAMPTKSQIAIWDRMVVPISRIADWLSGFCFGKTVVIVWQATEGIDARR